jgi:hypothetical protein
VKNAYRSDLINQFRVKKNQREKKQIEYFISNKGLGVISIKKAKIYKNEITSLEETIKAELEK